MKAITNTELTGTYSVFKK